MANIQSKRRSRVAVDSIRASQIARTKRLECRGAMILSNTPTRSLSAAYRNAIEDTADLWAKKPASITASTTPRRVVVRRVVAERRRKHYRVLPPNSSTRFKVAKPKRRWRCSISCSKADRRSSGCECGVAEADRKWSVFRHGYSESADALPKSGSEFDFPLECSVRAEQKTKRTSRIFTARRAIDLPIRSVFDGSEPRL